MPIVPTQEEQPVGGQSPEKGKQPAAGLPELSDTGKETVRALPGPGGALSLEGTMLMGVSRVDTASG